MILPDKYIPLEETLLGLGWLVLEKLDVPLGVLQLWRRVKRCPPISTYQRFILTLDFLYALGAVEFYDGKLRRRGA